MSLRLTLLPTLLLLHLTTALHHMKRAPLSWVENRAAGVPLVVTNMCREVIYPAIVTQSGTAPIGGFMLDSGQTQDYVVSSDWQGRVWGRTNCSFNPAGTAPSVSGGALGNGAACSTGDCGGIVNCRATVSFFFVWKNGDRR